MFCDMSETVAMEQKCCEGMILDDRKSAVAAFEITPKI